jgi:hypothetical protein
MVWDTSPSCMLASMLVVLLSFLSKVQVQSNFLAFVIPYPAICRLMGDHSKTFHITKSLYLFRTLTFF